MGTSPTVLTAGTAFEHLMAFNLDPGDKARGLVRCIESREGSVDEPGFIDKSHLRTVRMGEGAEIGEPLTIDNEQRVLETLPEYGNWTFLGFEDPTLWRDSDNCLHLYFTVPFHNTRTGETNMYLGHASGPCVDSLTMRSPVLGSPEGHTGAKEVAFMPPASDGYRNNLVESSHHDGDTTYSVIRRVRRSPGGNWAYDGIALHPAEWGAEWCAGHVSPGPVFPESFGPADKNRRVCILNGREENQDGPGGPQFGRFAIGLMVYNVETGTVERISQEPVIDDTGAKTITFGSEIIQTAPDNVKVYAHVDDSYVREYDISYDDVVANLA